MEKNHNRPTVSHALVCYGDTIIATNAILRVTLPHLYKSRVTNTVKF